MEGNSKWYARIKVLETVADAMEKKIKEVEKNRKMMYIFFRILTDIL